METQPASMVEGSRPCAACGYDLQGLPTSGDCPECGLSIALSLTDRSLRYADPRWVSDLKRGTTLILVGIGAMLVGLLLIGVVHGMLTKIAFARLVEGTIELAVSTLFLAGTWLISQPDPANRPDEDPRSRSVFRWASLVVWLLHAGWVGVRLADPFAGVGLEIIAAVAGGVAWFAGMTYAPHLALRFPDQKLASLTKIVKWGSTLSAAGLIAVMLANDYTPEPFRKITFLVAFLAAVSGLFFGLGNLIAFVGYHVQFRIAAEVAHERHQCDFRSAVTD